MAAPDQNAPQHSPRSPWRGAQERSLVQPLPLLALPRRDAVRQQPRDRCHEGNVAAQADAALAAQPLVREAVSAVRPRHDRARDVVRVGRRRRRVSDAAAAHVAAARRAVLRPQRRACAPADHKAAAALGAERVVDLVQRKALHVADDVRAEARLARTRARVVRIQQRKRGGRGGVVQRLVACWLRPQ